MSEIVESRLAAIAAIHGNTWMLDAVPADIRRRGAEQSVNLGDSVYGSLDPADTAAGLMHASIPSISGNQDGDVFAPSKDTMNGNFRFFQYSAIPDSNHPR